MCGSGRCLGRGAGLAEGEPEGGQRERGEHDAADNGRDPAASVRSRPHAVQNRLPASVRPAGAAANPDGAHGREHDGQQGDGRGDRRERHQNAAVADAAQERHRNDDQGEQSNGDGDPGEDDSAAGVLHGPHDGLARGGRRRRRSPHASG